MNLFIKIYLKLIKNFWRIIIIKITKNICSNLIIYFNFKSSLIDYLSREESVIVAGASIFFVASIGVITYMSIKLYKNFVRHNELSTIINNKNDVTVADVRDALEESKDISFDILLEVLFIFTAVSLFSSSGTVLLSAYQTEKYRRALQWAKDFGNIRKVLL